MIVTCSIGLRAGFRHRVCLAQRIRLSLSERERIKVRDCFRRVARARSKSLLAHYRVPHELGDSKIGGPRCRGEREILPARDRVSGQLDNYVLRRLAQLPALPPHNKNRGHKDEADAAAGICSPQNCGFVGVAKEHVPIWSGAFVANERGSRRHLRRTLLFGKAELTPHLNPLPLRKGRGGVGADQPRIRPALTIQKWVSLPWWIGPVTSGKRETGS
jgi:hypothetical protein